MLSMLVAFVVASVLLCAGLGKFVVPTTIRQTLTSLGVPLRFTRLSANSLAGMEMLLAMLLILASNRFWPAVALASMGVLFGLIGMFALVTRQHIPCSCWGSNRGVLGWAQVIAVPAWLFAAWLIEKGSPWTRTERRVLLMAVLSTSVLLRFIYPLILELMRTTSDRRATNGFRW